MKIQKRFLRKYKDKEYYKYVVNIPPMILREAGFNEDENFEFNAKKGKIELKKKKPSKNSY